MLREMKRRFVTLAILIFAAVMMTLVVGINLVNYSRNMAMQDDLTQNLMEMINEDGTVPDDTFSEIGEMPGAGGEEARFMTRFFYVGFDSAGNADVISRDYIAAIDEETAENDAKEVLAGGKTKGYYGNYRYFMSHTDYGVCVLFLNVSNSLEFSRNLLIASALTGGISLAVVALLVLLFSGRAMKPYAENIEKQKRFITDAGHELKTPIASITTSADIAAMNYEDDEWIENIRKQTARLSNLVGDLVTLSRLDEELPIPEKTEFNLSDALWEISEPFASRAKALDKEFDQEIEDGLRLKGDKNLIFQMVSILLDNAIRYSDRAGNIKLSAMRKFGKVNITMSNTCDLDKTEDLNRLFDRFYRPDESRSSNTGGSGIGLSMAKSIAEAHGGRITVRSMGNHYIIFKIVI